jgi:hypothetical protein
MKKENLYKYRWTPTLLVAIAFLMNYAKMHIALCIIVAAVGVAGAIFAFKHIPKFFSILTFILAALFVLVMI